MVKRIVSLFVCLAVLAGAFTFCVSGLTASEAYSVADGIIAWKKSELGQPADGFLIDETYAELAGSSSGDWYPIAIARLGIKANYRTYLVALRAFIESLYSDPDKLGKAKATDLQRISLAFLATGGDPTSAGKTPAGDNINLIADGVYDRGKVSPLGQQGINGWIWGLIALDSMRYEVPEGAFYTRDEIVREILCRQLPDGGFAFSGSSADADMTAMAIQALAPYYNTEKVYSYTSSPAGGDKKEKTVREAVDAAIQRLSEIQLGTGDFAGFGGAGNSESTAQVIIALCCLGIDPASDTRFVKNGNTALDGLMRYRTESGGFAHLITKSDDGSGAVPGAPNSVSGWQSVCALASFYRLSEGLRTLYDLRPEHSRSMKERLASLRSGINAVGADTKDSELEALLEAFYSLPEDERCYAYGYVKLYDTAKARGIDIDKIAASTEVEEDKGDAPGGDTVTEFTDADRAELEALPDRLTTEYYTKVLSLLAKLELCEDFDGRIEYIRRMTAAKEAIEAIQTEIDDINDEVKEKLYPFENLSLKDRKTVNSIVDRYLALSEYDREKVLRSEDVLRAKAKLDSELRSIIIGVVLIIAVALAVFLLVRGIYLRRHKKERELEALSEEFRGKDE